MSKSRNLLAQAKQFLATKKDTYQASTFKSRTQRASKAAGIRSLSQVILDSTFWRKAASVAVAMGSLAYTQTIGITGWLAEKVMNLPVNLAQMAIGIVTTPFAVVERVIRADDSELVTTKPYRAFRTFAAGYKTGTNYIASTFVRATMDPFFRIGVRWAFAAQAVLAVMAMISGTAVGVAISQAVAAFVASYIVWAGLVMVLVMLEDATGLVKWVKRETAFLFDTLLRKPTKWVGGRLRAFADKVNEKLASRRKIAALLAEREDLIAQRDLAQAERDFAFQQQAKAEEAAAEAEEATLIYKSEAERMRKNANGYRKPKQQRERRTSGNPANRES